MLGWIKKFIKSIPSKLNRLTPTFNLKVIDIPGKPADKNIKISYQFSGKATVAEDTPQTLLYDLIQLRGFSVEDSRVILDFFKAEDQEPEFKICNMIFSESGNHFEIKDIKNDLMLSLTADQIFESQTLIKKISAQDLKIIAYSLVDCHLQVEKGKSKLYVVSNQE